MEQQEKLFYLKYGALYLAQKGFTTQITYAKLYSKTEATAVKKYCAKNKLLVEIVEAL